MQASFLSRPAVWVSSVVRRRATQTVPSSSPAWTRADKLIGYVLRIGVLVAILLIWQWLGDDTSELAMPTFTRTASSFTKLIANGELWTGLIESNKAMVLGYLFALLVGMPLGVVLGTFRAARRVVQPYLSALLVVPMIAVVPLIQATFGLGILSRVVVVFIFSFVFVSVNTMVGVSEVDRNLREMALSFCATRTQALRRIVLPAALPNLVAGARLALARAIVGMVIAELFLVGQGVGSLLIHYRTLFDSGAVFALAISLVLEGVIVMRLATAAERASAARWLR